MVAAELLSERSAAVKQSNTSCIRQPCFATCPGLNLRKPDASEVSGRFIWLGQRRPEVRRRDETLCNDRLGFEEEGFDVQTVEPHSA